MACAMFVFYVTQPKEHLGFADKEDVKRSWNYVQKIAAHAADFGEKAIQVHKFVTTPIVLGALWVSLGKISLKTYRFDPENRRVLLSRRKPTRRLQEKWRTLFYVWAEIFAQWNHFKKFEKNAKGLELEAQKIDVSALRRKQLFERRHFERKRKPRVHAENVRRNSVSWVAIV